MKVLGFLGRSHHAQCPNDNRLTHIGKFGSGQPSRGRGRLLFALEIPDRVRHPVPFVKPGNVPDHESFVGLFLGPRLRARAVKPDQLTGGGLNFNSLHLSV